MSEAKSGGGLVDEFLGLSQASPQTRGRSPYSKTSDKELDQLL